MRLNKYIHEIMLILAAFIWGSTFVAQSLGMNYIGAFTFNSLRSLIAFVFLTIYSIVFRKQGLPNKKTIKGGIICGLILTLAMNLQQYGLLYTTVGKAGFITVLYIMIVPILSLILGKKITSKTFICVLLALVGLYFLTMSEAFSISYGDFIIFITSFLFALHIMCVDHYVKDSSGVQLSYIQLLVVGVVSFFPMVLFEKPTFVEIHASLLPLLYAAILSSGIAYTLQIVGQKGLEPTVAGLLMSLESVFSALSGYIVLHQSFSGKELFGAILIFGAIILKQFEMEDDLEQQDQLVYEVNDRE